MLLFGFLYSVAEVVMIAVIVFQFLAVLLTCNKNDRLLDLGGEISAYIYQALRYLTYNSEQRPYPFSDLPSDQSKTEVEARAEAEMDASVDTADKSEDETSKEAGEAKKD